MADLSVGGSIAIKINSKITELLLNLSEMECSYKQQLLTVEEHDLRKNLLQLYRATDNPASHDIIVAIMTEAGFPWFGKFVRSGYQPVVSEPTQADPLIGDKFMSDDDFIDLLPANGFFH